MSESDKETEREKFHLLLKLCQRWVEDFSWVRYELFMSTDEDLLRYHFQYDDYKQEILKCPVSVI